MSNLDIYRAMASSRPKNLSSPFNEAFSFTELEYARLKKIRPDLFSADTRERHKAWLAFGNTSIGRAFRVR